MNMWDVFAIVIMGIALLDFVLLAIYIMRNDIRKKREQKQDKINIIDNNAGEIVAIVQELAMEDKIKIVLIWDKGRVEVKGRRMMDQRDYDLKRIDKWGQKI